MPTLGFISQPSLLSHCVRVPVGHSGQPSGALDRLRATSQPELSIVRVRITLRRYLLNSGNRQDHKVEAHFRSRNGACRRHAFHYSRDIGLYDSGISGTVLRRRSPQQCHHLRPMGIMPYAKPPPLPLVSIAESEAKEALSIYQRPRGPNEYVSLHLHASVQIGLWRRLNRAKRRMRALLFCGGSRAHSDYSECA